MGAMITIIYDKKGVQAEQIHKLAEGSKRAVEQAIGDSDVFVYCHSPDTVLGADPIEIFIQLNAAKTSDAKATTATISDHISAWKESVRFALPININVIPVAWYSKIGL